MRICGLPCGFCRELRGRIFPDVDPSTAGVKATDTIVLVLDAQRVFPGRATGADQLAPAGFPSVVLAPNGQPGFTFGSSTPVRTWPGQPSKQGNGAVVKKGGRRRRCAGHRRRVGRSTVFTSTWDDGDPSTSPRRAQPMIPTGFPGMGEGPDRPEGRFAGHRLDPAE